MKNLLKGLSRTKLEETIMRYGSPLFLFNKKVFLNRYNELEEAFSNLSDRVTIGYSYKTNPLPGLIMLAHEKGTFAEVVSAHEYELARILGIAGENIIFNGPTKGEEHLRRALNDRAFINVDNFDELKRLEILAKERRQQVEIGLRFIPEKDGENWNRFGFPLADEIFSEAVSYCSQSKWLSVRGLHAHIGTNIRDMKRFENLGKAMVQAIKIVKAYEKLPLKWLDFGGGGAGVSPRYDEDTLPLHKPFNVKTYAEALLKPVLPYLSDETQIFIEPGRTLVDECGLLLTSVLAVRQKNEQSAQYVLDSGINLIPTIRVYKHPIHSVFELEGDQNKPLQTTLLGASCMGHDVLAENISLPELQEGSLLTVSAIGAYNVSRGVSFIHRQPAAVLWDEGQQSISLLRQAESFDDYIHNQVVAFPKRAKTS